MPSHATENDNISKSNSVIMLLLDPYIEKSIQDYFKDKSVLDHFGNPTALQAALYDAKINEITKIDNEFSYRVNITVPIFYGAHIPYGLETMVFSVRTGGNIVLESYTHKATT